MIRMFARVAGAAVCSVLITSAAMAEDLSFNLINQSSSSVVEFYVSHTGTNDWEENLLSGGYLPSGNEIDVMITDGRTTCMYDVKASFEDGSDLEEYDLNLCELGSYTFQDQ